MNLLLLECGVGGYSSVRLGVLGLPGGFQVRLGRGDVSQWYSLDCGLTAVMMTV